MSSPSNSSTLQKEPEIKDRAFAKRLLIACEANPRCPNGRGQQKWVRDGLREKFDIPLTAEAVSKWFAGETRPRPEVMQKVAAVLEADEAWLSLGRQPDMAPRERVERAVIRNGAVNYVAGIIELAGGRVAFPEDDDGDGPDLFAIINGRQRNITVVLAAVNDGVKFVIPAGSEKRVIIGVIPTDSEMSFDLVSLTADLIEENGVNRGGFSELTLSSVPGGYSIGGRRINPIRSISGFNRGVGFHVGRSEHGGV